MRIRNLFFFVLWLSLLSACDKNGEAEEGNYVGPPLIQLYIFDSKYFAVGERVVSISFAGEGNGIDWSSDNPGAQISIPHGDWKSESMDFVVEPDIFSGKFVVVTNRYTYEFTQSFTTAKDKKIEIRLDFAAPDVQPKRKVGIMGDSISTFKDAVCDNAYACWYPGYDPNVSAGNSEAVNTKERTYWWILVNELMKNGELDSNSSWSGTRIIHEVSGSRSCGYVDRVGDFVDPDIIIIHGGTNDRSKKTPLGNYDWDTPIEQLDYSCFRSAYIMLIKLLQMQYEGVQLILIIGDTLTEDYESSIVTIARHYNIPYVDFVGIDIPKCNGSHPNYTGMKKMAQTIYDSCHDYYLP